MYTNIKHWLAYTLICCMFPIHLGVIRTCKSHTYTNKAYKLWGYTYATLCMDIGYVYKPKDNILMLGQIFACLITNRGIFFLFIVLYRVWSGSSSQSIGFYVHLPSTPLPYMVLVFWVGWTLNENHLYCFSLSRIFFLLHQILNIVDFMISVWGIQCNI